MKNKPYNVAELKFYLNLTIVIRYSNCKTEIFLIMNWIIFSTWLVT